MRLKGKFALVTAAGQGIGQAAALALAAEGAQVWAIQAALPRMLANNGGKGSGSIINNMARVCSSLKGLPNRSVYGTILAR